MMNLFPTLVQLAPAVGSVTVCLRVCETADCDVLLCTSARTSKGEDQSPPSVFNDLLHLPTFKFDLPIENVARCIVCPRAEVWFFLIHSNQWCRIRGSRIGGQRGHHFLPFVKLKVTVRSFCLPLLSFNNGNCKNESLLTRNSIG